MILYVLRVFFVILAASVTALYTLQMQEPAQIEFQNIILMMTGSLAIAMAVVFLDMFTKEKKLSAISGIFLGLIVGLLAAFALSFVVDLIGELYAPQNPDRREIFMNLLEGTKVLIGLITCYMGISLVLQTKDDFRFVIPYVEFAKQIRGTRPTILDTSVIVDGRIVDIVETGIIQGTLVIPRFVLNELQLIADSSDKLRRARGRRGLDILQKLQANTKIEVMIDDSEIEGGGVDQKLINMAHHMRSRVMTNDYNLNKIATLRGQEVININDLAKAMRPVVLPGEAMTVKIVKPGEGSMQGVGYLDDGTMVVVEGGRHHIGEVINLFVTSTLQTSAGRMIFGRHEDYDIGQPQSHASRAPSRSRDDAYGGGERGDDTNRYSTSSRNAGE